MNETDPYPVGYAPLGWSVRHRKSKSEDDSPVAGARKAKYPISVVVYPCPRRSLTTPQIPGRCVSGATGARASANVYLAVSGVSCREGPCPPSQPGCWYSGLFIFGDDHYNAAGNALVADWVIKSLTEEPPAKLRQHVSGPDLFEQTRKRARPSGRTPRPSRDLSHARAMNLTLLSNLLLHIPPTMRS